ncbi:MAG: TMEM175 family protein [Pyrinomonadaceae bacterium]
MIREKLMEKEVGFDKDIGFRMRGVGEIARIEAFSDAVFAFAVTLLVVSLEVPKTFGELMETMRGFGAFAICFLLFFFIWFNQYKFFRRYGLEDNYTVWLNAALIFVALFYVYPLKFLFSWLIDGVFGGHREAHLANGTVEAIVEGSQITTLMIIYGLGYIAVFSVFILLYLHAYRKRFELELNELEIFDTLGNLQENALNVCVGLISIAIAFFGGPRWAGVSGMTYMLLGVVMSVHGAVMGKRRRKLEERFAASPDAA